MTQHLPMTARTRHDVPVTLFDPPEPEPGDALAADRAAPPDGLVDPAGLTVPGTGEQRRVYTDGACSGNPGPGGWGWVMPEGPWASGAENPSTNQRMELAAVLHAVRHVEGPLEVVSDSTYVVNCFRDRWWAGWEKRGWRNSQKKEVANQDLWKPLVALYKTREDLTFTWVKGHAGDHFNDEADRLAVEASRGEGSGGAILGF